MWIVVKGIFVLSNENSSVIAPLASVNPGKDVIPSDAPLHLENLFRTPPKKHDFPSVRIVGLANHGNERYAVIEYRGKQFLIREGDKFQGYQVKKITPQQIFFSESSIPQSVTLQRRTILKSVAQWNEILRQVRILPYEYQKDAQGYILLNIRPSSFVEHIGFRSGDIIKIINGREINGLGDLVSLYEQLNHTTHIRFDIRRGVKDITLDYEVKDEVAT
jgi:type II secretory pathway component PulC